MISLSSEGEGYHERVSKYFADFNLYAQMAHFVGKELHIRPGEILDTWGVPELIVAYGHYANETAHSNYMQFYYSKHRDEEPPEPRKYAVRFIGVRELNEYNAGSD